MRASKRPDSTPAKPPWIRLHRQRLKALMELAKWSNTGLADAAGIDQSAVGRLLSGELQVGDRSIPGLIWAIRDKFGDKVHTCSLFDIVAPDGTTMTCLCGVVEHLAATPADSPPDPEPENGPQAASA